MAVAEDVLRLIRQELEWALEGPEKEGPQVFWHKMATWKKLTVKDLKNPDATAFRVDGELFFGDDLRKLEDPSFFIDRNPRHVAIRMVGSEDKVRNSYLLIRGDLYPADDEELKAAFYL